jgi:DNA-binding NarL/FixJ family response regulator
MTEDNIKVLLVDDQPLLRMGFRLILEGQEDFHVVGEASDGIEAVRQVEALQPDVVLMDVRMPGMDGIEATRRISDSGSDARVIILTTFDLDEYAFTGLQAGASAFLLKDVAPSELVHAVRLVASGDAVVAPRVTQRLLELTFAGASCPVTRRVRIGTRSWMNSHRGKRKSSPPSRRASPTLRSPTSSSYPRPR